MNESFVRLRSYLLHAALTFLLLISSMDTNALGMYLLFLTFFCIFAYAFFRKKNLFLTSTILIAASIAAFLAFFDLFSSANNDEEALGIHLYAQYYAPYYLTSVFFHFRFAYRVEPTVNELKIARFKNEE